MFEQEVADTISNENDHNTSRSNLTVQSTRKCLDETSIYGTPNTKPDRSAIGNDEDDDEDLNEQSFEVIPPASHGTIKMNSNSDEQESQQAPSSTKDVKETNLPSGPKQRSNSESNKNNSISSRFKNSSSFLSKLQSSSGDDHDGSNSNNISSSIASAFSSLSSSITSNFTLNSTNAQEAISSNNNLSIETASTSTRLSQITETREDVFNRRAQIERQNLIALTKLIVKDLISSSLMVGRRTIDDIQNTVHLNNYFTLIDRVLKHGLKQNLLTSSASSLWNAIDSLPKYMKESTLMSESIRSLAYTKTPDGKIKAWMRLAMMQKKLPEYFNELLANRNILLKDIYHDYAFMLNDEAHVFAGLIIGVNVIDCNFFVKDDNFDVMNDIISLSPYLKNATCFDDDNSSNNGESNNDEKHDLSHLNAILDQKNYLEEWNKRLEANIVDLHAKIKSLEDQNSRLEMESKVSEARILKLQSSKQGETPTNTNDKQVSSSLTGAIKSFINNTDSINMKSSIESIVSTKRIVTPENVTFNQSDEYNKEQPLPDGQQTITGNDAIQSSDCELNESTNVELQKKVEELELAKRKITELEKDLSCIRERTSILESSYKASLEKIKILERDIDVQTSINSDKETTIKMYEKDMREKQTLVESLRNSLNDSKKLQADMSEKLADTSAKLKDRIKSVQNLQTNLDKWKLENKTLATKLQEKQATLKTLVADLDKAHKIIEDLKKYNEKVNDELRMERESGHSSSVTVETQTAQIVELKEKLACLEVELKHVKPFKDQTEELSRKCREYEQSLEEIGDQLRESRLEMENLKENSAVFLDSQWTNDKQVKTCTLCQQLFTLSRRKHHCRLCGNVFCQTCSDNKMELASSAKPVRVCDTCHAFLLAKFVKSSA